MQKKIIYFTPVISLDSTDLGKLKYNYLRKSSLTIIHPTEDLSKFVNFKSSCFYINY